MEYDTMNFKTGALIVGGLIALPIAFGAYSTFSSVATAPSRVINKTLQTDNIIFNYERFFDVNANFTSRSAQVKQYKEFLATETDPSEKVRLRTEMAAMQQSCRELATKYNADSQKMNRSVFKDSDLPYTLNIAECE
jgi:hypothetical protein